VRSSSGTPMAVWQPRQARLPGLTPDEVREHMSPRLRDLDSRRNRGPHTGSRSPHTRRQGPARRGAGAVLMDHHCQGLELAPAWRQAGSLRGVAGSSCVETPSDLRIVLVRDGPRGSASKLTLVGVAVWN
jgi:hypothetical protein